MRSLRSQIIGALFVILTVAVVAAAFVNFRQQSLFHLPDDGVVWVDRQAPHPNAQHGPGVVEAFDVMPGSPAANANLQKGDVLERINGNPVGSALEVARILGGLGHWEKAEYWLIRQGKEIKTKVIVGERVPTTTIYYQYVVGAAYLAIGLFILFRRGNAPKAHHFFALCLASFVLCTFHYTGKLNTFDTFMYWGNVAAGLFAPTLFFHFCLTFPDSPPRWRGFWRASVLYIPATIITLVYFGVGTGRLRVDVRLLDLRWMLDQVWMAFLALGYLAGAAALALRHRRADDSILRQQMKWVRNGALLGIVPFTFLYVIPYAFGVVPGSWAKISVLSLALIPVTWAYAIARYRLMDVDVIFAQGYVYTLATVSVLGIFYGLVFSVTKFGQIEELAPSAVMVLIIIATFVFQPIRNWLQENLDRHVFYKESYDYRRTLIEFARDLSSETDVDKMLSSTADRLLRTLNIQHLGFFTARDAESADADFELAHAAGSRPLPLPEYRDLGFLTKNQTRSHLFFEQPRSAISASVRGYSPSIRQTIAELDFTYYLACNVRGRTIAYLGVSRTLEGDFLTSDDLELLETISGYIGIAIENGRLYNSLQRKVDEYERLKEFSENIVESINVGILAADLDDRVESWNSQIERLTGVRREHALGRRLADLLPAELVDRLAAIRGELGIHHFDKFRARFASSARNGNARDIVLNIAVAPLVSRDSEQIGRLIILDDITERSALEQQLVQADKLSSIGLLAAGVAHEVNTPLAVISTYAQMLSKQVSGDEQKSVILDKIAKQTFRASEIVNSLLNFSRTSATEFGEVDLNRLVRDTVSLVDPQLKKATIQVDFQLADCAGPIRGNAGKLQQVLLNLLLNARDALEPMLLQPKQITLRTRLESGAATLEITDNGPGIPADVLPRIFDPFFTTKGPRKGTGLGLSISYGIVQEHKGQINAYCPAAGGTTFRLQFPLMATRLPEEPTLTAVAS